MVHIVEELWIFSRDGIPLVEIFKGTQINNILIGGFLSAMKTFAKEMSGKTLNSFTTGPHRFYIASSLEERAFLVCKYDSKVKEKKIKKVMEIIIKFFEDMYSINEIENWNGKISYFDKFKDRLELYFEVSQV
jgi:chemotaxis protein CheY-P-specific phosphatase CheC